MASTQGETEDATAGGTNPAPGVRREPLSIKYLKDCFDMRFDPGDTLLGVKEMVRRKMSDVGKGHLPPRAQGKTYLVDHKPDWAELTKLQQKGGDTFKLLSTRAACMVVHYLHAQQHVPYNLLGTESLTQMAATIFKHPVGLDGNPKFANMKSHITVLHSLKSGIGKEFFDKSGNLIKNGVKKYIEKGVDKEFKWEIVLTEEGDMDQLISPAVFKVVSGPELVKYFFHTLSLHRWFYEQIEGVENREAVLAGFGILLLKVEMRQACTDSSLATAKIRGDGSLAKQGKADGEEKAKIKLSLETSAVSHLSGLSLPTRYQKAVRSNCGAATWLVNAFGAKLAILRQRTDTVYSPRALKTAINALEGKLTKLQFAVAKSMENSKTAGEATTCFRILLSTLDVFRPRVDVPCTPHPVLIPFALCSDNLWTNDWYAGFVYFYKWLVPGASNPEACDAWALLASHGGLYLDAGRIREMTGCQTPYRDELCTPLKWRLSEAESGLKVYDIPKIETSHFIRGSGATNSFQAIEFGAVNTGSEFKGYIHLPVGERNVTATSQANACAVLTNAVFKPEIVKREAEAWSKENLGEVSAAIIEGRGYFNKFEKEQTRAELEKVYRASIDLDVFKQLHDSQMHEDE